MTDIINKILPATCILCGYFAQQSRIICFECEQDLPILSHYCQQCAQFLPVTEKIDLICGACLQHSPPFDFTHALFPYQAPIIQLIIQLKFRHQLSHAQAFARFFIKAIQKQWYAKKPLPDLIIPVPLHPIRLRERGFNQALEIAKPIAKALGLPIDNHGAKRIKHTVAQSSLPARERKQNIANAFSVHRNYTGLSIALIDDVITTAHTVTEISAILKQHGAKRIDVWCCARRDIALKAKTR